MEIPNNRNRNTLSIYLFQQNPSSKLFSIKVVYILSIIVIYTYHWLRSKQPLTNSYPRRMISFLKNSIEVGFQWCSTTFQTTKPIPTLMFYQSNSVKILVLFQHLTWRQKFQLLEKIITKLKVIIINTKINISPPYILFHDMIEVQKGNKYFKLSPIKLT